ncbi:hypothetical protein CTI12_AA137870 [Artemisia annua]|uniref:Uncharacterized protein n=1 Tax=Artemisia annua TaxID=35608 RepID=A0A2U1NKN4_ARTAN|nr:hypothetical protein CTI12_AA137870 [Artemisia annua]
MAIVKRKSVEEEALIENFKPCKKRLRVAVKTIKKIIIEHDDDDAKESQCSSVGSNDPVYDAIYLADINEEDEVESTSNGYNDVTCGELSNAITIPQFPKIVEKKRFDGKTVKQKRRKQWFLPSIFCGTRI